MIQKFPITRWNSLSNLAYPVAGAVNWLVTPNWITVTFFLLQTGLGYGSFLYHSRPSVLTRRYDWTGMWSTMSFIALLAWYPGEPWIALSGTILAAILSAVFIWRQEEEHFDPADWHMGVLFSLAFIASYLNGDRTLALLSTGTFILAFGAWQLERLAGWKHGHGVWHCLTAIAQVLLLSAR